MYIRFCKFQSSLTAKNVTLWTHATEKRNLKTKNNFFNGIYIILFTSYIGTNHSNFKFLQRSFVYLLFEFFDKVKVSIEVKIHHKMPIDEILVKRSKTSFLVNEIQKLNRQKFRCKNSRFVLVVPMR